jgi:hypothetical protein
VNPVHYTSQLTELFSREYFNGIKVPKIKRTLSKVFYANLTWLLEKPLPFLDIFRLKKYALYAVFHTLLVRRKAEEKTPDSAGISKPRRRLHISKRSLPFEHLSATKQCTNRLPLEIYRQVLP